MIYQQLFLVNVALKKKFIFLSNLVDTNKKLWKIFFILDFV